MKSEHLPAKNLIKGVLDKYQDTKLNIASEAARDILTEEIYEKVSKYYHLFRKNKLIVED
tara:strand:+ start:152 stop:331 length:180 start_codon:yes stop_codon:yes gene_type:complete